MLTAVYFQWRRLAPICGILSKHSMNPNTHEMWSSCATIAAAIRRHVVLLLSFRHDGRGLPNTLSPAFALIAGSSLLLYALVTWSDASPGARPAGAAVGLYALWLVGGGVLLGVPFKCLDALAGMLMLRTLFDGWCLLLLAAPVPLDESLRLTGGLWMLFGVLSLASRVARRRRAATTNSQKLHDEQ